jgi:UDP-N-acetylglucosamine 4,6-dehydratase (inverting)
MLNKKSILITGGTGSFGQKFISEALKKYKKIKRLIIFSRDELKQSEMEKKFPKKKYKFLRFFIGDVRDYQRLYLATKNVDIIIHAAALKQVPATEYNPFECIKTNVLGAQNIINAAIENKVSKVVALSTDKAVSPINLYGASKLCADKLFTSAQNYIGPNKTIFSVARYGNVMNSRGSVIPLFLNQKKNNLFTVTDKNMTRFNITLKDATELVFWTLKNSLGGEILVPKIPSYRILDLAKAISADCKIKLIGIRPGEKIHEELITSSESVNTLDLGKYYVILPTISRISIDNYKKRQSGKRLPKNFSYNSGTNSNFLSITELKKLLKKM